LSNIILGKIKPHVEKGRRRKRGHPRKTWIEGVRSAMTTRNLEPDQWRNREEWRLVSGRWRQLLKNQMDGWMERQTDRQILK